MEYREKVELKDWTWWKIGGPADFFCQPETVEEVQEAVAFAKRKKIPLTILGGGTNVLVSDQGVEGLVVCMRKLKTINVEERDNRVHITAMAGVPKSDLTKIFMQRRLAPALFMCGLPGDVGGGVVMNAGVGEAIAPREFVEIVDWIEVLDLSAPGLPPLLRLARDEVTWTYRNSSGWQPGIVVRVGISWPLEPDSDIPHKVREATSNRLHRQPLDLPSCGSTFKNPKNAKAGAMIEQAGLKGYQVGGAQVSKKHANFIVNVGGATANDVMAIIRHIQSEVKKQFALDLETEVKFLGRW